MADGTLVSSGSSGSMPTGSGSERLRRATIHALNQGEQEILSGTPGHIYTIISIIFNDQTNAAGTINIVMHNGTSKLHMVRSVSHSAYETFVFNDRFVIEEDDDLIVYNSVTDGDWIVSYIDQDWT